MNILVRLTTVTALTALFLAPSIAGMRALRIRSGGALTTAPSAVLPVNSDMTLRLLIKRNSWDLAPHEILALFDTDGSRRISLSMNTSPWMTVFLSDNGWNAGSHKYGWEGCVYHGCPNGSVYEDWWVVYKAPTPTTAGFLRVYRSGQLAPYYAETVPFDIPIPAGTDMRWKGKALSLRIGDPVTPTMADYQVMGIGWWTEAFSSEDIAVLSNRQISNITDDTLRHYSTMFWYARPSSTYPDRIACEFGAVAGNPALDAYFSGDVTYTTDTPRDPTWTLPDDIIPPDPGLAPIETIATETAITALGQPGSADTTSRTIVVSEGPLWEYTTVAQSSFGPTGPAEMNVNGLKPGSTYFVTGIWKDDSGNAATHQVAVRTNGVSPPPEGPTCSLHITNDAEAVTATDATGATPLVARMPYESDTTIRLLVRRNGNWSGLSRFFSQRATAAGPFGYARFYIGTGADGHLIGGVSDGQLVFEADADEPVSNTSFDEIWLVYTAPTSISSGQVSLYKGTVLKSTVNIPAGTDMSWKKWDAQLVFGGLAMGVRNAGINYDLLEPAWWTRALTPDEMAAINGKPLYSLDDSTRQTGDLYWYARPHYTEGRIEPDLGASIGTTLIRQPSTLTYTPGTLAPLICTSTVSRITFGSSVPPALGGAPYSLADVLGALQQASGLARNASAYDRLNLGDPNGADDVIDIADAVRINRIVAGLF